MSDGSDTWQAYREHKKETHEKYRYEVGDVVEHKIALLRNRGYSIKKMQDSYRINDRLDIYWLNKRFHDIKRNLRGDYDNLMVFVMRYLPLGKQKK